MRLGLIGAAGLLYLGTQCAVPAAELSTGMAVAPGTTAPVPGAVAPVVVDRRGLAELARLNAEILQRPQDTVLNLRYAALADKLGLPRLALTAYERILVYDPHNSDALDGVYRVRAEIQPNTTQYLLSVGGIYESNPLWLPSAAKPTGEGQFFGDLNIRDERRLWDTRWRTNIDINGIAHGTDTILDYAYAGGTTGPLWEIIPGVVLHPEFGGGGSYFDGHFFYDEAIARLTFEAYPQGSYDSISIGGAFREYDSFFVPKHDGGYVDVIGKFTLPVTPPDTTLRFSPWLRWAAVDGPVGPVMPVVGIQPGDYYEAGGRLDAFYAPVDWVDLGANFTVIGRRYWNEPVVAAPVGTATREDVLVSPGVSIIFPHVIQYQNRIRLDVNYVRDDSNDPTQSYEDWIVTVMLQRGF